MWLVGQTDIDLLLSIQLGDDPHAEKTTVDLFHHWLLLVLLIWSNPVSSHILHFSCKGPQLAAFPKCFPGPFLVEFTHSYQNQFLSMNSTSFADITAHPCSCCLHLWKLRPRLTTKSSFESYVRFHVVAITKPVFKPGLVFYPHQNSGSFADACDPNASLVFRFPIRRRQPLVPLNSVPDGRRNTPAAVKYI